MTKNNWDQVAVWGIVGLIFLWAILFSTCIHSRETEDVPKDVQALLEWERNPALTMRETATNWLVEGAGMEEYNGLYTTAIADFSSDHDGQPIYTDGEGHYLFYVSHKINRWYLAQQVDPIPLSPLYRAVAIEGCWTVAAGIAPAPTVCELGDSE